MRWRVVGLAPCFLALMMNRHHHLFVIELGLERFGFPVGLEEVVAVEGRRGALRGRTSVSRVLEVVVGESKCRIDGIGFGPGAVPSRTFVREQLTED